MSDGSLERVEDDGRLMEQTFSKDEEIVITSIAETTDGFVMAGSSRNDNYGILIAKMNKDRELEWRKTYGLDSMDCEGQDIVATEDGFLVCGCSEGRASESGGHDWKAYLLKVDLSGERQWERSFRIKGNECAFSLLANKNIMLFGETRNLTGKSGLFLLNLDSHGEEIWRKTYCSEEDVIAGGVVPDGQGYTLAGSLLRKGEWLLFLLKVDMDGEVIWRRSYKDVVVYDVCAGRDGILLTGMRNNLIYLAKANEKGEIEWERACDDGCGLTIQRMEDRIAIAGRIEVGESTFPVLCKVSEDGDVEWKRIFNGEGFVEEVIHLEDGYLLVQHRLAPKEHTEIVRVDEDGL